MTTYSIRGIYAGPVREHYSGDRPSAIDKQPLDYAVRVEHNGIRDDEQADRINHGGPDRALLHYCRDHYAWWREQYPEQGARFRPPGFGENLSSSGMNETSVHIGDIYRIGGCRVQVAQPRTPCWKLNVRFGISDLARQVQNNARCGWFYRVLEPGDMVTGDAIELLERPADSLSVAAAMHAVYLEPEREQLRRLSRLEALAPNWRRKAEDALQGRPSGNSLRRLTGR